MTTIARHITHPRQAHEVMNLMFKDVIKPYTEAHGHGVLIWQTASDYRRHQLRKMFHGPVLTAIAEQVRMKDSTGTPVRWSKAAWKKALAEEFLPARFEEYTNAAGEIKVRQLRASTEAVSDDDFRTFLLEVQAWAAGEGVEFPEEEEGA